MTVSTQVPRPRGRIDGLRGRLLAQCLPSEIDLVYQLAARPGAGVVVTTQDPTAAREALEHPDRPPVVLLDAARYVGVGRARAAEPFRTHWLELQRSWDLPVLTDSGYCAKGDYEGLVGILERTAANPLCTIALLPLAAWWLSDPEAQNFLCEHVPLTMIVYSRASAGFVFWRSLS